MGDQFDVVVVGGGTAGLTAALAARHEGARVALVEREGRIGGDCTYYGCVPSKALIEIAHALHGARQLAEDGILEGPFPVSYPAVAARLHHVVAEIAADERDSRFLDAGIDLVYGPARFVGDHELAVGDRCVRGRRFVLATGTEPAVPAVAGLDRVPYLTNRTIFDLSALPQRLIVLGGGGIGLELAQTFRRFGSDVVVIELLERLLANDEPEAGELARVFLEDEGIDIRLGAKATAAHHRDGRFTVTLERGEVSGDALLVAAGRRAAVVGLGLETVGVDLVNGYVRVDRRCRTSRDHVYAAGDVTGGLQFTHVASHEGAVAGRNAAGKRAATDERVVPWITFLDPEVAHVGLTEEQARERHRQIRVVTYPMSGVDRARIAGRTLGFVKLVTTRRGLLGWVGGGMLVGAEIVGPGAGELIHECALAIRTRAFAGRLAQTIHAYPALSLAIQQAASQLFPLGRSLVESR